MQVIADTIKNADAVLSEMLTLTDTAFSMAKAVAPIQELMKQSTTRKSPPVLAAESGKVLKENFIEDFRSLFPNVSSGVTNGRMGTASYRLHDGVYKLGNALQTVQERKFMIVSDDERRELSEQLRDVVADFAIYTIIAFDLHNASQGTCTMAINKYCERRKVSPSILLGELMGTVQWSGRTYYAYEHVSPLYTDMMAAEPLFLTECEEQELPLTEELAASILDGRANAAQVMEQLLKQASEVESKEVSVNPMSLISRMSLE